MNNFFLVHYLPCLFNCRAVISSLHLFKLPPLPSPQVWILLCSDNENWTPLNEVVQSQCYTELGAIILPSSNNILYSSYQQTLLPCGHDWLAWEIQLLTATGCLILHYTPLFHDSKICNVTIVIVYRPKESVFVNIWLFFKVQASLEEVTTDPALWTSVLR